MSGGRSFRLTSAELHSLLAIAWEEGHRHCYDGGGEADNPYKEEDRGALAKEHAAASSETPSKEISDES